MQSMDMELKVYLWERGESSAVIPGHMAESITPAVRELYTNI